ncbi:MFS transporter [Actinocorallia longicatena]|uniref:MFS transporter n=1 Tax=Actinocorallia longicatena TaxID=111803 RepID=A0ABP6QDA2_9ACTN
MAVSAPPAAPPRLGPVFAVVIAGVAMSNLDLFIVNVALPVVGDHFAGSSLASLSWILNAYAVVFAALLVPAGGFADRTSPRRAYLAGVAVFTAASVLCALAPSVWALVAARVLQAAGAALLMPASLGLLLAAAPADRRVTMIRAWTAAGGVAAALGPVAGGLLTALDWRWVFLVNVPIGVAALLAGRRVLPATPGHATGSRPDLPGAALLTAAIALLALGLVKAEDWGWSSAGVPGSLAASAVLLAVFFAWDARRESPIVPLGLLRTSGFGAATAANLLFSVAFAAMLLGIVLWAQTAWAWSALRTGLAVAPGPLMVPALAIGAAPLVRRWGPAPVAIAGAAFFAAGNLWWAARIGLEPDYPTGMLPGMLLTGIGVGLTLPTLVSAAVSVLPPQSFSTGSAVVTMARQIGSVIGVAALVAVLGRPATAGEALTAADHGWLFIAAATAATAASTLMMRRSSE